MNDTNRPTPTDEATLESTADLLISRMIDCEASEEDERAFAQLAESRPALWRELALQQRDAAALTAAVERRLTLSERVTLAPSHPPAHQRDFIPFPIAARKHASWLFASAGWAAAIAMVLVWRLATPGGFASPANPHIQNAVQMTPEEQLRSYLQAPYVLGELDAVMERVDTLPDGRIAVVALRRIQEVLFLDESDVLPVDDERHFMKDPAELRSARQ